jgi:hypothetical protein
MKVAMWLAVMSLSLCLGCGEALPKPKADLKFSEGDVVEFVIGGIGQVIDTDGRLGDSMPYRIRLMTEEGPVYRFFREYEIREPRL